MGGCLELSEAIGRRLAGLQAIGSRWANGPRVLGAATLRPGDELRLDEARLASGGYPPVEGIGYGESEDAVEKHLVRLYGKFAIYEDGERRRVRLANAALGRGAVTLSDLRS